MLLVINNALNFKTTSVMQKKDYVPTALREGMGMAPAATGT